MTLANYPVFDLHCDLLSYLATVKGARPDKADDIACALPLLQAGNVKLQVMAIYTDVRPGSAALGLKQSEIFKNLLQDPAWVPAHSVEQVMALPAGKEVGIVAAIENAAGFCEAHEPLDKGLARLEEIIGNVGKLAYISLTHHTENRFGGGNYSEAGLKADGKIVLDYLHGKRIAIDLSHTSDALAEGILDYLAAKGLDIPVIASHSNFRSVFTHARNLTTEVAKEIIKRRGLIGLNFLRAFLNDKRPEALYEHIAYGMDLAKDNLAFGADFFYTASHPDLSRIPFYQPGQHDSAQYPGILTTLGSTLSQNELEKLAYRNVLRFMEEKW
jgi:membrane dipeptidase